MNRKIAVGLIFGSVLSIIVAVSTADNKYYNLSEGKYEVPKENYDYFSPKSTNYVKETKYNSPFILIGFLCGLGIGYILTDYLSKKK